MRRYEGEFMGLKVFSDPAVPYGEVRIEPMSEGIRREVEAVIAAIVASSPTAPEPEASP